MNESKTSFWIRYSHYEYFIMQSGHAIINITFQWYISINIHLQSWSILHYSFSFIKVRKILRNKIQSNKYWTKYKSMVFKWKLENTSWIKIWYILEYTTSLSEINIEPKQIETMRNLLKSKFIWEIMLLISFAIICTQFK